MANRLLTFARLAHEVATRALPERAHRFAPKRYTQPQLLACLLLKEYLGLAYRTAQEALDLSDGLRDALLDRRRGHVRPVPLGDEHRDQLAAPGQDRRQPLGFRIGLRSRLGADAHGAS
jgi:hypothetical protein